MFIKFGFQGRLRVSGVLAKGGLLQKGVGHRIPAMSNGAKNRVRLWLRGEKALGLKSVKARKRKAQPEAIAEKPEARSQKLEVRSQKLEVGSRKPDVSAIQNPKSKIQNPSPAVPLFSNEPFTSPILSREEKIVRLREMDEKEVKGCVRCGLCKTRTNTVFGEGDPDAKILFIGEGPGETEDETGRPFVGRAGELLTKMIIGMGLQREQVYIANIVKCRPPGNRAPAPEETITCTPYLVRQIEIIRPAVIVTLGLPASQFILQSKESMGRLRGHWHLFRGIKVMPTYHPAYILRNYTAETRGAVWSDLQQVMVEIGLPPRKIAGG
jgi:uracil-DNA glycosylase